MSNYLFISDAAKEVNVESHVLRYWEEELHLPIKRNELGHRYYTQEDVERFKQIKGMKERGLQLKAIKMILKDGKLDMLIPKEEPAQGAESSAAGKVQEPEETVSNTDKKKPAQETIQNRKGMESVQAMPHLNMDVVEEKRCEVSADSKEDKSRRLQWLLQQLIRETLQENNGELCREIKESVVKELDYQFRMQEEREDARDKLQEARNEEHYRRMDELLRKKAKKTGKERSRDGKKIEKAEAEKEKGKLQGTEKGEAAKMQEEIPTVNLEKADKKKRHFIF